MKKTVNLADRKEALELLKQLYGKDKHDEGEKEHEDSQRETGANSSRRLDELSPHSL